MATTKTAIPSKATRRPSRGARRPDPVTAYVEAVRDGKIVAGRYVRLACLRHLRDLEESARGVNGLTWSWPHAKHAIEFFPTFLRLGDGTPFELHPFQVFKTGCIFGWLGPDGRRRFRRVYDEEAKGQGKTPWLAGLLLYSITCDEQLDAECYVAAVTREQARLMFEDARKMALASPDLQRVLIIGQNAITHPESKSFVKPISSEGRSLDGKRVQVAAIDEVHEHRTSFVVDKLAAGRKHRKEPLIVEITNSGSDRQTICWRHHEYVARILEGAVRDDEWFGIICGLDVCEECRAAGKDMPQEGCPRCDNWRDERVWPKANPLLGTTVQPSYLRAQVREAINMPAQANIVKRLNFCIWTQTHSKWLDVGQWIACADELPAAELEGRPCYAGLDLGQAEDLSAFVRAWILEDGRIALAGRYRRRRSRSIPTVRISNGAMPGSCQSPANRRPTTTSWSGRSASSASRAACSSSRTTDGSPVTWRFISRTSA